MGAAVEVMRDDPGGDPSDADRRREARFWSRPRPTVFDADTMRIKTPTAEREQSGCWTHGGGLKGQ